MSSGLAAASGRFGPGELPCKFGAFRDGPGDTALLILKRPSKTSPPIPLHMPDPEPDPPSDKQLVPNLTQIVPPLEPAQRVPELDDLLKAMGETLNQAMAAFSQQSVAGCDQALARIRVIHDRAKAMTDGPEIFFIAAMKSLISLYAVLARTQKYMMEGRFTKARQEAMKAQPAVAEGAALMDTLFERSEEARDAAALRAIRVMFPALGKMISGLAIQIQAEELGFRGRIPEYLEMLKGTVAEFRAAAEMTGATDDPNVSALHAMLNEMADRFETRTEFFELGQPGAEKYLQPSGKKIFIIHGHDEAKWRELVDLLEDDLKCETIELAEQVNESRTIISKFEDYANECCYAFAMLTPDDFAKTASGDQAAGYLQARPNVLFELGWFYGRFGPKRLSIIKKKGTQMPTDLAGVAYIEFTANVKEAFMDIRGELRRAGAISDGG